MRRLHLFMLIPDFSPPPVGLRQLPPADEEQGRGFERSPLSILFVSLFVSSHHSLSLFKVPPQLLHPPSPLFAASNLNANDDLQSLTPSTPVPFAIFHSAEFCMTGKRGGGKSLLWWGVRGMKGGGERRQALIIKM